MFFLKDILYKEHILKILSKKILKIIGSYVQYAEFIFILDYGINVHSRYGKIDFTELYKNKHFQVKVYHNKHLGTVNSTNFNLSSIISSIKMAKNIAYHTSKDKNFSFPNIDLLAFNYRKINLLFPYNLKRNFIKELVIEAELSGLNSNNKIINTEGSMFNGGVQILVCANTYGMISSYNSSMYSLSASFIAKDFNTNIMQRDYEYSISRKFSNLEQAKEIGKKAALNTISRLGAKKIKTMKIPIIMSSRISWEFFMHLAKAINGRNVYKKSTFLLNFLGKRIFPLWLSIQENPYLNKGLSSKPFDMEGTLTTKKYIINKGILSTWLLDNYSAKKLGFISTGNFDGINNWSIKGSVNLNFKDLLKSMNCGILVTEFMGDGVNIINGNYSRGIFGYWVENGIIQYPVSEITLSGNLKDFFNNIQAIGNDINIKHQIASGSILFDAVQISGL